MKSADSPNVKTRLPMGLIVHGSQDKKNMLTLNRDEVLRYLAYRGSDLDMEMDSLIDSCMDEALEISQPKYVYGVFEKKLSQGKLFLLESTLELAGDDIISHLDPADHVAVMAATLGVGIDRRIKYYGKSDLTRGIILDSWATQLIEALCDQVEREIGLLAESCHMNITSRYSPGYGDLPIGIQKDIIASLNASRLIGLNVSESSILLPRKSVTAFIGISRDKTEEKKMGCKGCNLSEGCEYNWEGENGCAGKIE